jgi:outer membrane protein TolC
MSGRFFFLLVLISLVARADEGGVQPLFQQADAGSCIPCEVTAELLGLEDAVALAILNDVQLAPYASALKLAQYRSAAFLPRDNPELRLGTDLDGADPDQTASIRFFPLHPWEAGALKRENKALVDEETAVYQGAVLETTLETMSLYHEIQCLEKEKTLYDRLSEIRQQAAERVERQVAAAVGTQAQGLIAYWEAHEALESRRNVEIESARRMQSFAVLIGRPVGQFNVAALDEDAAFTPLDVETSTQAALGNRPELQLLRARRASADARLRGAKADGIPWLNHVEVGYRKNSSRWELGAAFDIPFFTVAGTDKMLASEALLLREIEVDTEEQLVHLKVAAAVQAYNVAVNEWNSLQAEQKTLMEKTRAFLESTPADNSRQLEDRVSLEEKLIRAEFKMLDVRRGVNQTLMELIDIVGTPI